MQKPKILDISGRNLLWIQYDDHKIIMGNIKPIDHGKNILPKHFFTIF